MFFWKFMIFFLQSIHNSDTRLTKWKQRKICIALEASFKENGQNLLKCLSHPKPKQRREERKPTDAPYVPPHSQQVISSRFTFLFIPEKSRSAAISVSTNAQGKVTSRNTC